MANEYPKGKIHKLFIGEDKKNNFEVGKYNEFIDATYVEITEDLNCLMENGFRKFIVIAESKVGKARFVAADPSGINFMPQYAKPTGAAPENIE